MDALSILALGVAQAGGGGGGGTSDYSDLSNKPQINNVTLSGNKSLSDLGIPSYTAGDNVTISNNEISVNGLALEKEDSFVQDGVDKVEVSGERVFLSQEVNGHYTKGLSLNPSGAINGDDQTASKLFGLTPSRLWFEDYNLDRTVRLAPNANYNGLTVNGNPIAMQSDIPAPELPTISSGDAGKVLTVNSGETGVEWATGGGGGGSYTFTNGLTESSGTVSSNLYSVMRNETTSTTSVRIGNWSGAGSKRPPANAYYGLYGGDDSHLTYGIKSLNEGAHGCIAYGAASLNSNSITASGYGSIAVGTCHGSSDALTAYGDGCQAFGLSTHAMSNYQMAIGKYNINDSDNAYAFIVGNGADNTNRSNALTVDWSGNLVCNNIPPCPSADGVYNLQVSIVSGVPTYSWVAQS